MSPPLELPAEALEALLGSAEELDPPCSATAVMESARACSDYSVRKKILIVQLQHFGCTKFAVQVH